LPEILIYPDAAALAQAACEQITSVCAWAIARRQRCSLALCGGSTPRAIYALLGQEPYTTILDWKQLHVFWGDERLVPPEHPGSNYLLAKERLLSHLPIPLENIHRMRGELEPAQAASDYSLQLQRFFALDGDSPPVFDLILLGMGEDGHVASLFPGSPALDTLDRWVVAVEHNQPPPPLVPRLTLTLPVLNAARNLFLILSGERKAERLHQVFAGEAGASQLPAGRLRPADGRLLWLVDQAAASQLTG
jgi:6-phosphogluconolactonase